MSNVPIEEMIALLTEEELSKHNRCGLKHHACDCREMLWLAMERWYERELAAERKAHARLRERLEKATRLCFANEVEILTCAGEWIVSRWAGGATRANLEPFTGLEYLTREADGAIYWGEKAYFFPAQCTAFEVLEKWREEHENSNRDVSATVDAG